MRTCPLLKPCLRSLGVHGSRILSVRYVCVAPNSQTEPQYSGGLVQPCCRLSRVSDNVQWSPQYASVQNRPRDVVRGSSRSAKRRSRLRAVPPRHGGAAFAYTTPCIARVLSRYATTDFLRFINVPVIFRIDPRCSRRLDRRPLFCLQLFERRLTSGPHSGPRR